MNPLLFIFDLQVRDIAEYIKSTFFQDEVDARIELNAFLNMERKTRYEYQMFYARMLYPSYYFDIYEQIMNNQEEEQKLIKIIEKNQQYEAFLNEIYIKICKIIEIDKIEWINKKKQL